MSLPPRGKLDPKLPYALRVIAPVPAGSGAIAVHGMLASRLTGYALRPYAPLREILPWTLPRHGRREGQLIHTTPDHAIFLARRRTPLVVTFHNYVLDQFMRPYSTHAQRVHYATDLRLFTRRALGRAEVVTAVSQATAALVRADLGFDGHIEVIPNGVDAGVFFPVSNPRRGHGPVRVLFAGNPTRRKGAHWLSGIASRLNRGIELQIACGLRGNALQGLAVANMKHLGRIEPRDMPALYRRAEMLLMPSVREGASLVMLEAMASGLPVVASAIPSVGEIVKDAQGGVLCPLGDVEAFASAINMLAADTGLRRAMGEHNRAITEARYRAEQMAARYRALFEAVLAGRGRRASRLDDRIA